MYRNCKWPPPWKHPCLSCLQYACACKCVCMCMHTCMGQQPPHAHPHPNPPTHHPPGGTLRISKNLITLQLIKIIWLCLNQSQFNKSWPNWDHSILICRDTPTHRGCMGSWVNGWFNWSMGGVVHITKYRINLDLIKIIQFCLKIYDLWRHPHLWLDGCVNGWAHVISLKSNKSWPDRDNSIMDIFWTFYLNQLGPL